MVSWSTQRSRYWFYAVRTSYVWRHLPAGRHEAIVIVLGLFKFGYFFYFTAKGFNYVIYLLFCTAASKLEGKLTYFLLCFAIICDVFVLACWHVENVVSHDTHPIFAYTAANLNFGPIFKCLWTVDFFINNRKAVEHLGWENKYLHVKTTCIYGVDTMLLKIYRMY